jgi:hypothetical protein
MTPHHHPALVNGATGGVCVPSVDTSCAGEIFGTKGRVRLERFWLCPKATVELFGEEPACSPDL